MFLCGSMKEEFIMLKRSLLFDVQQDGASPSEEPLSVERPGSPPCRALVKVEPVPEWFMLYFNSGKKK
jgi:hypothetical protein